MLSQSASHDHQALAAVRAGDLEGGERTCRIDTLLRLAGAMAARLDELQGQAEEKNVKQAEDPEEPRSNHPTKTNSTNSRTPHTPSPLVIGQRPQPRPTRQDWDRES